MDYEAFNKSCLEEAKKLYQTANQDQKYALESLFPELKESEDERIRKAIIGYIDHIQHYGVSYKDMIAWLEKQGKQKPAWSENDGNRINRLIAYFEDKESFTAEDDVIYANWLKSLKDRCTWKPSDEQMEALKGVQEGVFRLGILESLYQDLMKLKG